MRIGGLVDHTHATAPEHVDDVVLSDFDGFPTRVRTQPNPSVGMTLRTGWQQFPHLNLNVMAVQTASSSGRPAREDTFLNVSTASKDAVL